MMICNLSDCLMTLLVPKSRFHIPVSSFLWCKVCFRSLWDVWMNETFKITAENCSLLAWSQQWLTKHTSRGDTAGVELRQTNRKSLESHERVWRWWAGSDINQTWTTFPQRQRKVSHSTDSATTSDRPRFRVSQSFYAHSPPPKKKIKKMLHFRRTCDRLSRGLV